LCKEKQGCGTYPETSDKHQIKHNYFDNLSPFRKAVNRQFSYFGGIMPNNSCQKKGRNKINSDNTDKFANWIRAHSVRFGKEAAIFIETVFIPIVINVRILQSKN
jgi:hypothetical protein